MAKCSLVSSCQHLKEAYLSALKMKAEGFAKSW